MSPIILMAVSIVKRCDVCGRDLNGSDDHFVYEEDGEQFIVNSLRLGNWNARTKTWDSIVSAYDICKDCGKQITQAIFNIRDGENNLKSRKKTYVPRNNEKGE